MLDAGYAASCTHFDYGFMWDVMRPRKRLTVSLHFLSLKPQLRFLFS